jgi:hypothetical protein
VERFRVLVDLAHVDAQTDRGRTTNATATMTQDGADRLVVHAVLGDLATLTPDAATGADLAPAPPICAHRTDASITGSV